MFRSYTVAALAALLAAIFPGTASAQWGRSAYLMGPNPFYVYPNPGGGYGVQLNFGVNAMTPYGPMNLSYAYPYTFGGPSSTPSCAPNYGGPGYMTGGGYGNYGSYGNFDPLGMQQGIAAAQKAATAAETRKNQDQAKEMIDAQWAYEKLGVTGLPAVQGARDQQEELQKALAVKDESEVASGEMLNRILVAIVIAESKGAKGVSAFLPPQLLDDVRFMGGPTADLLNVIRLSGKLPYPPNFPGPALQDLQANLDTDFAAAIAPLKAGKAPNAAAVQKLATDLKKLEDAAPPIIRNLSFPDAIAARKFLNQLDTALKALKGTSAVGLINPKWSTEGTSVSDLVKHMTKYKLMFGPAPQGAENSYLTLHKALATYMFVLTQVKK